MKSSAEKETPTKQTRRSFMSRLKQSFDRSSETRAKSQQQPLANNVDYIRTPPRRADAASSADSGFRGDHDDDDARPTARRTQDDSMINDDSATTQRRQKPTAKRRLASFSVRSSRHRDLDSAAVTRSGRLVASSTKSVAPQRQFCTSVEPTGIIQPALTTVPHNVSRNVRRYSGAEFTAASRGQQDIENSGSGCQKSETGDRRPLGKTDSIGMNACLSDDDYHSPDSAYHSSHGSGNSTAWNGGQGFDGQLSHHQHWLPAVVQDPSYLKNHEKFPSWLVTEPSVLPPVVGSLASSWTDNTRTNNAEVYSPNPVDVKLQSEDGQPSPRAARRYFEEVGARLHEQQYRSEFQTRTTTFHPNSYAVGYRNSPHQDYNPVHNTETSSTGYSKVDAGWLMSYQSPEGRECSPGPPPLPSTSPPHDPPPRYSSSGNRSVSSLDIDRLTTPYNAVSHRDIFDTEHGRESLPPTGPGMRGMQAAVSMSRIESFSKTSSQPFQEPSHLVNGRLGIYENGSGNITPLAVEGSSCINDRLPTRILAADEDDLRSRLDRLPANQSQTSVLRRLSQEYFGACRSRYGINPPGRMSLGSTSSCISGSGNDLSEQSAVKNTDVDYRHLELEGPNGVPRSSVLNAVEPADDTSANFVRCRKTQMSLRKAFGIFDDFDVAEADVAMKQLPILTEDVVPSTGITSTTRNDSSGLAATENHRVPPSSKGRISSESEFRCQFGDSHNFDHRSAEKPAVDRGNLLMQRSMSLGSAVQPAMMSAMVHGHGLSTASDAHSTHSSSSGSTNGVRSSLDLSTGSSPRSTEILPGRLSQGGSSVKDASPGDVVKQARAKSKSLPRDALLLSDVSPSALSLLQCWQQSERLESVSVQSGRTKLTRSATERVNPVATPNRAELTVHTGSGICVDDSAGLSPPAPALPPRRYRGEVDLTAVDRLPPSSAVASASRFVDPTNGESTLPHDTYANQLRRQARRYQHCRGSSFSHSRPPLPEWKPPPPPSLPPEPPPPLPPSLPSSDDRSFEPEFWTSLAEDAPSFNNFEREFEASRSWAGLTSSSSNYATELEPEKSSACTAISDVQTPGLSLSDNRRTEVRQTTEDVIRLPHDSLLNSNSSGDQEARSSPSANYRHPEVDVVSGYDRYYSIGDHMQTSLSRSFSSFIPSDSQSGAEVSCGRRSSHPAVTRTSLRSDIVASAIDQPTRSPSFFSTNSDHSLLADHEAGSISDNERRHSNIEVQPEVTVFSSDPESFSNIDDGKHNQTEVIEPTLTKPKFFRRLTFPVEVDCARQAEVVAGLLRRTDRDEALVSTLVSTLGHHTATDFMAKVLGIVECEQRQYEDFPEVLQLRLTARDFRHAALGKTSGNVCSTGPALDTRLTDHSSRTGSCASGVDTSLDKAEESLMDLLERKLKVLRRQKQLLQQEISDNKELGVKVSSLAEAALSCRERDKFDQYMRDVDKATSLLLKLSEMLARADNAVTALPTLASDTERKSLVGRRDDLTQKHDDAALLHSDIERRSRPLLLTLCSALSPTDFADVEYQALMRTQLVVELQDVDTAISLADRQLALLRTSVNGSAEGEIDA